ncbi:hypothetical protein D3C81_1431520 [compost metagenome]
MAPYLDAAKYILEQTGAISAMKLQKLMYYSQAWSLVWEEAPLFEEDFQAWANGPVLPELYQLHKGQFTVDVSLARDGNVNRLNHEQKDSVKKVLAFYAAKNAQTLSNLTHQEKPWLEARGDTAPMEISNAVISKASMHEYYSSL